MLVLHPFLDFQCPHHLHNQESTASPKRNESPIRTPPWDDVAHRGYGDHELPQATLSPNSSNSRVSLCPTGATIRSYHRFCMLVRTSPLLLKGLDHTPPPPLLSEPPSSQLTMEFTRPTRTMALEPISNILISGVWVAVPMTLDFLFRCGLITSISYANSFLPIPLQSSFHQLLAPVAFLEGIGPQHPLSPPPNQRRLVGAIIPLDDQRSLDLLYV